MIKLSNINHHDNHRHDHKNRDRRQSYVCLVTSGMTAAYPLQPDIFDRPAFPRQNLKLCEGAREREIVSPPTPMISLVYPQLSPRSLVSWSIILHIKTHVIENMDIIDNKVVKQSSSRSQGPRLSPELGISSDIIQDNRRIPSSTSSLRMSSIPRAKSETLRRSPRKRNRVSFDPDDLPCINQPPTVYKKITGELNLILIF